MKTLKTILVLVCSFLLATGPASATLTATVTPGYTFSSGEMPTIAKLNQLAQPTVLISGSVDGSTGLTAGSVTGNLLADSVPNGTSLAYNGSSPRQLYVITGGLVDNTGGIIASNNYLRLKFDTNYFRLDTNSLASTGSTSPGGTNWLTFIPQSLKDTNISPTAAIQLTKLDFSNTNLNGQQRLVGTDTNGTPTVMNLDAALQITNRSGTNLTLALTSFTSPQYTIAAGTIANTPHGWTNTPMFVRWVLVCTTTNNGYAIGDEIDISYFTGNNAPSGVFTAGANSTNVFLSFSGSTVSYVTKGGSSTSGGMTSWRAKCYARP